MNSFFRQSNNYRVILVYFIAMLMIIIYSITTPLESSKQEQPIQNYSFDAPPLIINCIDSPYSLVELDIVLSFWENIGYEFLDIVHDFNCDDYDLAHGSIMIMSGYDDGSYDAIKPYDNFTLYGITTTNTVENKNKRIIVSSKIEIIIKDEFVLEHELGHALGWEHFDSKNHIMSPLINDIGPDNYGLQKK